MSLAVRPLHPIFAVEIVGADLATEADEELVRTVENAMAEYAVCIVRDASLSDDDHIRFSRAFGPLELPPKMGRFTVARRLRRELFDASNLGCERRDHPVHSEARRIARGAERFHTDSSFNKLPTKWSLLLGHTVPPEGGDTHFIDTRAVYDALPQETRNKIETLVGIHDFWRARERTSGLANITAEQRASLPPVMHRLVRTMPYGRKALYIGGHAVGIVGWPDDEAVALLDELYEFATQDRFIYVHKWRPADLVIWDNRCTLHRATPLEGDANKRDVRRTTINEYGPETSVDVEAA